MEVHELKEVLDQRFIDLNTHLTTCFQNIETKTIATDLAIEKIDRKVSTHDHWLWFFRGTIAVIVFVVTWIGIKIRF